MTQAGYDLPFAEGAEFTEWKTDAFTNQATTARFDPIFNGPVLNSHGFGD